jgi:hypothetical protein
MGQKGSNKPQGPKTEFGAHNQHGVLHVARKKLLLRVKKVKISYQSAKTEFGAQIQYGVSIEEEKIFFWGSKGENKPLKPKNGT